MIQLGLFLLAGGVGGAIWRHVKTRKSYITAAQQQNKGSSQKRVPLLEADEAATSEFALAKNDAFDDVGELQHYQKVSWYTLALVGSGTLFYAPVILLGLPLLGYNTYHFARTLRHSSPAKNKSALTVFEVVGVVGTVLTGQPFMTSLVLSFSFGSRNLLLQAGNIANNIDFSSPVSLRHAAVWVLRDGAEIEINSSMLRDTDIIVLHGGDMVVVEGNIVEGAGQVRQFSLESKMKLVPKSVGDKVYPMTVLDSGSIRMTKA